MARRKTGKKCGHGECYASCHISRVWHNFKHKACRAHVCHELIAAALIVLADGIIKAVAEADYATGAVKSVAAATIIALGVDV